MPAPAAEVRKGYEPARSDSARGRGDSRDDRGFRVPGSVPETDFSVAREGRAEAGRCKSEKTISNTFTVDAEGETVHRRDEAPVALG